MNRKSKEIDKNSLRNWIEDKNTKIGKPLKVNVFNTNPMIEDLRGNNPRQHFVN